MKPVEKLSYDENSTVRFNTIKRFVTELKWIQLLQSVSLLGLHAENIMRETFLKCHILMCFLFFEFLKPDVMVKGKNEVTNVKDVLHKNLTLPLMTYH